MDLNEYQRRAHATDQSPRSLTANDSLRAPHRHEVIPLLGLVGEVGSLLGEYKKLLRDGATHRRFRDEVAEELGDILWYVASVASKFDLHLDDLAQENLAKVEDRWLSRGEQRVLYDENLPPEQQLPRRFEYTFEHRLVGEARGLVLVDKRSGDPTGDFLTDNAYEDDGYRFHDVLHLSFLACLGWSPVWRKILRSKKLLAHRVPRELDEVEDGGRAQVVEEAIIAAAYVYAENHGDLAGVDAVDWSLLRHVKLMTAKVEVRNRPTKEWNDVLLRGLRVWRDLRAHHGGTVRGDLLAGTIDFIPPEA